QIKEQLEKILQAEQIEHETDALWHLAQAADGSMRDALSLTDQAIAFGNNQVTEAGVRSMLGTLTSGMVLDLVETLANSQAAQVLQVVSRMAEHMPDFAKVLADLLRLLHDLAIAQVVPEVLQPDGADNLRKSNLARLLTPEDIQLFYQIGILGQRDLELAPDSRMAFEMVLLRMLAFHPNDQALQSTNHRQPQQQLATLPQAPSLQQQPITAPPAAKLQQQPVTSNVSPESIASPTIPPTTIQLANNEDWHNLIRYLKLTGLTGQLANNCEFKSWDGHTLNLYLDAAAASLKVATAEEKMLNTLRQHLGPTMQMYLKVNRTIAETPAQRNVQEQQQRQQEYQHNFINDPFVRMLQDTFQAEVIPNSIQPRGA
ncbi:hypothetical protein TI05_16255, partial [Achromatium sp. WMS3]